MIIKSSSYVPRPDDEIEAVLTRRSKCETSLPLEYNFNSGRARKQKKELEIRKRCERQFINRT